MRPLRIQITDSLIDAYGLKPHLRNFDQNFMNLRDKAFYAFHSEQYIDILKHLNDSTYSKYKMQIKDFGFSNDCPYPTSQKFYDYCKLYTKGSLLMSRALGVGLSDIAVN